MKVRAQLDWITLCAGFYVCLIIAEVHGQTPPTPAPRRTVTSPPTTKIPAPRPKGTPPPIPTPQRPNGTPPTIPFQTTTWNRRATIEHNISLNPAFFNPCVPNPCKNWGTCIVGRDNSPVCFCPPGYNPERLCDECFDGTFGDECKQICHGCDDRRDCHHVTGCRKCDDGYDQRGTPTCERFDCNRNDPCHNGATCHVTRGCKCPKRFTGLFCDTQIDTSDLKKCNKKDNSCVSGNCFYIKELGSEKKEAVCMCWPPRHGEKCQRNDCLEKSENCAYGLCVNASNRARLTCFCHPGHHGLYCNRECANNYYGWECGQRCGHCSFLPCDKGDGSCGVKGCEPGWTGKTCDTQLSAPQTVRVRGRFQAEGEYLQRFGDPNSDEYKSLERSTKRFLTLGARPLRPSAIRVDELAFRNGSVVTEYTMELKLQKEQVSLLGDVAANFNKNLKANIKNFQSEFNLAINPSSLSAQEVEVQASQDTSKSFTGSSYIYVAGGLIAICVVTIVVIFASRRKTRSRRLRRSQFSQGRARSRYTRSVSSSGRNVRP